MEGEDLRMRNDIQDVKDQNELLEFRILELEVKQSDRHKQQWQQQQQQQIETVRLTVPLFIWKPCLLFRRGSDAHLPLTSNNSISQKASVLFRSTARQRELLWVTVHLSTPGYTWIHLGTPVNIWAEISVTRNWIWTSFDVEFISLELNSNKLETECNIMKLNSLAVKLYLILTENSALCKLPHSFSTFKFNLLRCVWLLRKSNWVQIHRTPFCVL